MAGDWIKMRVDLATDPAVIGIAAALDCHENEVVGMLHKFWSWADAQSRDGHASGVTKKWIDRYVQRDGFSNLLEKNGWLVVDDDGITIPHFDRHNGAPAKARALAKDRQQNKREKTSRETSRSKSDESVTREEREKSKELGSNEPVVGQVELLGEQSNVTAIRPPYDEILGWFRQRLPSLPQPRNLDDDRKKAIRTIMGKSQKHQEPDFFDRYFEYVSRSDFLMGRDRAAWKGCNFDWLMKYSNFRKVVEGNYDNDRENNHA